ncbi:MAG: recombinase family protein, partial [Clostridia bacterium]
QFALICKYCLDNNLELSTENCYSDEALTGTNTHRKGFNDLLLAAQRGEFDYVVLYDLTRGSRDVVDWFTFRKNMKSCGVSVVSVMDKLGDLDDPSDFISELITVGIGQMHVLSSRVKSMDKIDYLAKQGKFLGGYAPLGYEIKDGLYSVKEDEATSVRIIFSMYAHGASYTEILAALPAGLCGKRGRPIGKNSIFEILRNERYIGTYSWCKRKIKYFSEWAGGASSERAVIIDDAIPPIIEYDVWKGVQERMADNTKNRTNKSRVNRTYLLSGLLRCGYCGSALCGVTTTNQKGIEYKFYTCGGKRRTRTCSAKNIAANDIEPLIVNLLRRGVLNGSFIEQTADNILAAGSGKNKASDAAPLKASLAALNVKINNLVDVLSGGANSPAVREKLAELEVNRA